MALAPRPEGPAWNGDDARLVDEPQGQLARVGTRKFGLFRHSNGWHGLDKMKYYEGHHFTLDVF